MAAAFMVDEAVRTEFGDADKSWALDRRAARRAAASRRNEGDQRQAREVVARQEPFGREVAVGVEIGLLVVAAAAQQVHLLLGVAADGLKLPALLRCRACVCEAAHGPPRPGALAGVEQRPPAVEGRVETLGRLRDDALAVGVEVADPGHVSRVRLVDARQHGGHAAQMRFRRRLPSARDSATGAASGRPAPSRSSTSAIRGLRAVFVSASQTAWRWLSIMSWFVKSIVGALTTPFTASDGRPKNHWSCGLSAAQ